MIRANLALYRQAQEMFRGHLVGVYQWDEVVFPPRKAREKIPTAGLSKIERRRIQAERREGKFEEEICLQFGLWEITVTSPTDHPPLGCVQLTGAAEIKGPLDPATWAKIGETIKQKTEELRDVEGAETDCIIPGWGRGDS